MSAATPRPSCAPIVCGSLPWDFPSMTSTDIPEDFSNSGSISRKGAAKPPEVIGWVFAAMGLEPDDELVDLYPGTGAVGAAWDAYRAQQRLDLRVTAHPELDLEGLA